MQSVAKKIVLLIYKYNRAVTIFAWPISLQLEISPVEIVNVGNFSFKYLGTFNEDFNKTFLIVIHDKYF